MIKVPYFMKDVFAGEAKNLFSVVSLFAGGGGSSTGYRLAGGKVLAINEFIPRAIETYRKNYPNTFIFEQDIRQLTGKMILDQTGLKYGELDILDGSPPCESFSVHGNREKDWGKVKNYSILKQRMDDLFFEFARIVGEVHPRVFVAENVEGLTFGLAKELLGSRSKRLFNAFFEKTFYEALSEQGYNVSSMVLDSSHYGVPQIRRRLILVGVRKDIDKEFIYPVPTQKKLVTVSDALYGVINTEEDLKFSQRSEETVTHKLLLQCKPGENFSKYSENGGNFSRGRLDFDRPSWTIVKSIGAYHPIENRPLTIPELKRIQGFPDDFILTGSFSNQWERVGNSVPPLMVMEIAKEIYKRILTK